MMKAGRYVLAKLKSALLSCWGYVVALIYSRYNAATESEGVFEVIGMGKPSVYHAAVVLFLEFFAFGLLAIPMIDVLKQTFNDQVYLINGLIQGIKGVLSFLSAPLLGALSDVWGRKHFLVLTVFITCAPLPLMAISPWWFFALLSLSGVGSVTYSIVFAYVADITDESSRSSAYGLVSATFAASIVTSPAIGNFLAKAYGVSAVVALATAVAIFDVCFILISVPESLPEQIRPKTWGSPISWDQADPFSALKKVGSDKILLLLCITVFLSYLPEAGEYAFVFLYIEQIIGFSSDMLASYIAVVGILSIIAQTALLSSLYRVFGNRSVILIGLAFEVGQLLVYAFGKQHWSMWVAGLLASISSINYPALSSFVSTLSSKDQQGVVQGMVTGIRGLCNGLGPAMFGLVFHVFNVQLNTSIGADDAPSKGDDKLYETILPGPPYLFGVFTVIVAIMIALFIPKNLDRIYRPLTTKDTDASSDSMMMQINSARNLNQKKISGKLSDSDDAPLIRSDENVL